MTVVAARDSIADGRPGRTHCWTNHLAFSRPGSSCHRAAGHVPGVAATTSECEAVSGTLTWTANLNNLTTQGTISGDLEGATFFQGDGTSLTPVTATSSPPLLGDQSTGKVAGTTGHLYFNFQTEAIFANTYTRQVCG